MPHVSPTGHQGHPVQVGAQPLPREGGRVWVGLLGGDTWLPLQGPGHEAAATQGGTHGDENGVQGPRSGGGPTEVPRWVPLLQVGLQALGILA